MRERRQQSAGPDRFQLEHAVNASGEAIFTTDREGVFTFVNREFVRLYGYTAEEVVGVTTPRILKSGRTPTDIYAALWQRLVQGEVVRGELVNRTRAGELVHIEFSANPVRDGQNEVVGFLGVQRDITARKQTEAALRASEARYRTLAEAAQDSIFIIGMDSRFEYMNVAAAAPFNLRPEDIIGKQFAECFPPDIAEVVDTQVRQVQRTRIPLYVEQAMQFPQGETWQSVWLTPILDEQQQVTGVMGISRDITARRRLAILLERHASLLNAVVEGSPIGIAVVDGASFVCNTVNPAFQRLVSDRAMAGVPFQDLWPGDSTDVVRMFERVLDTGAPDECVDVQLPRSRTTPDSQAPSWVTVSASPLQLPGVTVAGLLVLITDTTSRKQLEAQFFQSQKMEAVGRLAGGIAHDFNNLLTSILGYSELLMDTFDAGDRRRDDLQEVRRAGESAAALTRHLLTFSRKQIAEPTILDINVIVTQFEKILRRTIGEDVALNLRLEPTLERIKIDASQLEQVLMNLTVNARDAMPRGGTLTIETANVALNDSNRTLPGQTPAGCNVVLTITDTGVGMSQDVQSHLFEPFFTTKDPGKGTGLGLSTVFGIVKQHNGHVAVSSTPNHGTTFRICFPQVERPAALTTDEPVRRPLPTGCETILIAEDDDALRAFASRTLESCGYRTLAAQDASKAIQMSGEFTGAIHLLLTDVVMPGAGGVELSRQLGRSRPEMRVLYTSGHADGVILDHGLSKRVVSFIQKPYTRHALAGKVRDVLTDVREIDA